MRLRTVVIYLPSNCAVISATAFNLACPLAVDTIFHQHFSHTLPNSALACVAIINISVVKMARIAEA